MQDLTKREFEIMNLLEQGFKIKSIASKLFITENTIVTILQNIYDKFEIKANNEIYNRKVRAIYLFKKYKNDKTLNNLINAKQKLIEDMDLCTGYYIEECE